MQDCITGVWDEKYRLENSVEYGTCVYDSQTGPTLVFWVVPDLIKTGRLWILTQEQIGTLSEGAGKYLSGDGRAIFLTQLPRPAKNVHWEQGFHL